MQRKDPQELELRRLLRVKRQDEPQTPMLGPDMLAFFKQNVQKRQTKLGALADCWSKIVPQHLLEHCALESLHAGTLKVIVDSSPHLYELKQLLLAGLQQQLLIACKSTGLRKVTLKIGRWYDGEGHDRRLRF